MDIEMINPWTQVKSYHGHFERSQTFIFSLELFRFRILNGVGILVYLRHSFSYIFFNPLFSEKQPLILLSGLFIFQKLVYDSLWLFVYNQIFL